MHDLTMPGEERRQAEIPEAVIRVQGLGKSYHVFANPRDRLKQFLWRKRQFYREFWALRGVTLDVRRGEAFGIVGRNGSGKSTLLQLICGTLAPSEGEVQVNGRIAALLELGSGFNPEFTGRENVRLNATILGMPPDEIAARLPEIEAFADIGSFIDEPVKHYSSGMHARLAFAVAFHTDPEVIVVDEALSVGDELFQSKCIRHLAELRERGVTLLFVSHSSALVRSICDRALVLDHGKPVMLGPSKEAIEVYSQILFGVPGSSVPAAVPSTAAAPRPALAQAPQTQLRLLPLQPDRPASVTAVGVEGRSPHNLEFEIGDTVTFISKITALERIDFMLAGMMICLPDGTDCYHTNTNLRDDIDHVSIDAGEEITLRFTMGLDLAPGVYVLIFDCQSCDSGDWRQLSIIYEALKLRIIPPRITRLDGGIAYLRARIEVTRATRAVDEGPVPSRVRPVKKISN